MAYRQSLMKCAEMHGVKLSGWRYNKSRSYLCFWKARWDETVGSQSCRFRRPTVMSQQKFRFALRGSAVSAEAGLGFYSKIDLGIARYHFEVGAGSDSFTWTA